MGCHSKITVNVFLADKVVTTCIEYQIIVCKNNQKPKIEQILKMMNGTFKNEGGKSVNRLNVDLSLQAEEVHHSFQTSQKQTFGRRTVSSKSGSKSCGKVFFNCLEP